MKPGLGKGDAECVLQLRIRLVESSPEDQRTGVVIEMRAGQAARAEDEADRRPLVEIEVTADVAEADPQEGRSRERTEAHALEDADPQLATVRPQVGRFPGGRGGRDQLGDVVDGGIVHPVEHDELGTQIQHLHAPASEVDDLGRRCVPALHDQGETDVLDAAAGRIHLVQVPILHYGPGERELTDPGDITHGLGACLGRRRVKLHRGSSGAWRRGRIQSRILRITICLQRLQG